LMRCECVRGRGRPNTEMIGRVVFSARGQRQRKTKAILQPVAHDPPAGNRHHALLGECRGWRCSKGPSPLPFIQITEHKVNTV